MAEIINVIESLENFNGKYTGTRFHDVLSRLRGSGNGLSDEHIMSLLTLLTSSKGERCNGSAFVDILLCCIPQSHLSSDVIDVILLWMLSAVHNEGIVPMKINGVLEWISGLLEFNLVDRKAVDDYYEMYYSLFSREACQQAACKLIHMLTRPEDVYRARVEKILTIHKRNGQKKHTAHLIELFKTFKPELVPESVKTFSRESAFGTLRPGLKRDFAAAHERSQSHGQPLSLDKKLNWISAPTAKSKSNIQLIPTAMYIHLGSELYRKKSRKVIDFLDKESLATYHLNCEIPTSILSLLLNEGGMHFLATHNSEIHARFSSVLFSCLYSGFISDNRNVPYAERDRFLEQLVILEDYMQQGIPVVSRFLALYIASWNGLDHQKHVYRLLERITPSSFAEFNDCVLLHLQTLFLAGEINEKLMIINALSKLIFNMFIRWNMKLPKENLFLGQMYYWDVDFMDTVPQLIQAVINFCETGLLTTSNNFLVLQESLSFFEMLADLQSKAQMELTVLPPSIFYRCLFSGDFSSLARACCLLLRLKDASEKLGRREVTLMNKYSQDVWNCFVNRKAFIKSCHGHILLKHDMMKKLIPSDPDAAFSLEYHPTMIGFAKHLKAIGASADDVLSQEATRLALAQTFNEFATLLDALEAKYSLYHSET